MVTQKGAAAAAMELELPPIKLSTESGESFVFTSTFEAASLAKVRDVNEDGTLVLDYDSMEDVSGRVSETGETTPSGIPDPDNAYCQSLYPDGMDLSQWGNLPRLQDSQPYYQADMSGLSSLEGYVPSEGAEIQPGDYVLFSFYRRGTGDTVSPSGYFGTVLGVIG